MQRSLTLRQWAFGGCAIVVGTISYIADGGPNSTYTFQSSAYPAPPSDLARSRDVVDIPAMREHMWSVFGFLTKGVGNVPWWRTWRLACTAYQNCPNAAGFEIPSELSFALAGARGSHRSLLSSAESTTLADSPIEVIYYNDAAYEHVMRQFDYSTGDPDVPPCLTPIQFQLSSRSFTTSARGLNEQFNHCNKPGDLPNGIADRSIPEFPSTAIALKTAWMVVKANSQSNLVVWDMEARRPLYPIRITGKGASDQGSQACPNVDTSKPVLLDCFYHFRLGTAAKFLRAPPFLRDVNEKDYIALVGMHVATKELPDWTWATFWWDPKPETGKFSKNRPDQITGVWRNYLMDTTFSQSTPRMLDGSINICFNPYLEGELPDGSKSSCIRCHRMAAQQLEYPMNFSPNRPVSASDACFAPGIKTDYMWSLVMEPNALMDAEEIQNLLKRWSR